MSQASPVHIKIDLSEMRAHIYNINIKLHNADKNQKFSLPCWTPGSYLMREFAQHILAIEAFDNKNKINIEKINKNTFQACNLTNELEINYQVYGFDSSIRAAYIDDTQAFFNGSSLFLCPENSHDQEFSIFIQKPLSSSCARWSVATAMPRGDVDAQGFGAYYAQSYEELIDYPVQISDMKRLSFVAAQTPHEIVLVGDVRPFDEQRLAHDLQAICEKHIEIFGKKAPFKNYLFIARFEENSHGGLEHRNSTMVLSSPYTLPALDMHEADAQYRSFLSLCSHEYFHAWNIKRLKPKNFVACDLNKECYTSMLWVFEGITSYYDDLVLRKADLISVENYLDILAKNYSRLLKNKGRLNQSLAQASFDAWIKFYRPNENSQNATVSYYLKGSFVGLILDLIIRSYSNNKNSLDDVMKKAFELYADKGISEDEFCVLLSSYGVNMQEFNARYIYGTEELLITDWLSRFGVDTHIIADEQTIDDKTKLPAYWGFKMRFDDHYRANIIYVDKDGPAMKAGLSPHDEILAINTIRLDPHNLADLMGAHKIGSVVTLLVSRKKIIRSYELSLAELPLSLCKLLANKEPSLQAQTARLSWLGQ